MNIFVLEATAAVAAAVVAVVMMFENQDTTWIQCVCVARVYVPSIFVTAQKNEFQFNEKNK